MTDKEKEPKKDKKIKMFWDKLAGKITIITTIITLLTGLLTTLIGGFDTIIHGLEKCGIIKHEPPPTPPSSDSSSSCSINTMLVETKLIKILPYNLKNILDLRHGDYWFHFTVQNKRKEPVTLNGIFHAYGALIPKEDEVQELGLFMPDQTVSFYFNLPPSIQFLTNNEFQDPQRLDIRWTIQDEKGCKISSGKGEVQVLPKHMFAWDFARPGDTVSDEFLLASLTAWTQWPADSVKKKANELYKMIKGKDRERQWFKQCYNLLREKQPVLFSEPFPPQQKKEQEIYTPSQILNNAQPTPLEAVLFIGALSKAVADRVRVRLTMIVIDRQNPEFILAWQDMNKQWHGFDAAFASMKGFDENERQTTAKLHQLFTDQPDLLEDEQMKERGVFLKPDRETVALDFKLAAEYLRRSSID